MFPYKEYNNNVIPSGYITFNSYLIDENDLEELNRKVYNYIDYETAQTLTLEEKILLKEHYEFLLSTYFTHLDYVLTDKSNDILFSYDQWNLLRHYALKFQNYNKNDFIYQYNTFINFHFNNIFSIESDLYNDFVKKINKIYLENHFENGDYVFEPINIEKFVPILQDIFNKYIADKMLNICYIKIKKVSTLPSSIESNTHILLSYKKVGYS